MRALVIAALAIAVVPFAMLFPDGGQVRAQPVPEVFARLVTINRYAQPLTDHLGLVVWQIDEATPAQDVTGTATFDGRPGVMVRLTREANGSVLVSVEDAPSALFDGGEGLVRLAYIQAEDVAGAGPTTFVDAAPTIPYGAPLELSIPSAGVARLVRSTMLELVFGREDFTASILRLGTGTAGGRALATVFGP